MVFRSNRVSSRGFTLIELMVVVGIIAFVTAATMPSFSLALLQNRQREAGALIVEAILTARSRAVRTGRCHQVRVWLSNPGVGGGSGGAVAVDTSAQFNCGQATFPAIAGTRVTIKSIATRNDPDNLSTLPLAGLVGRDVAFTTMWVNGSSSAAPATDTMMFGPDGMLVGLLPRSYQVQTYLTDGTQVGLSKFVNVSANGSVEYATIRR